MDIVATYVHSPPRLYNAMTIRYSSPHIEVSPPRSWIFALLLMRDKTTPNNVKCQFSIRYPTSHIREWFSKVTRTIHHLTTRQMSGVDKSRKEGSSSIISHKFVGFPHHKNSQLTATTPLYTHPPCTASSLRSLRPG